MGITSSLGQFCEGTHKADKPTHQLWNSEKIVDLLRRHHAWPNIHFDSEDAAINMLKDMRFVTAYLAHLNQGSLAGLSFQQIVYVDPAETTAVHSKQGSQQGVSFQQVVCS